jgi:enoyl-[acyl-carrier protein] reductase I
MQNLFHDGGFSSMGMSYRAMQMYNRSLECEDCPEIEDELGIND